MALADLRGRTALVTGGGRGIGAAIAAGLRDAGCAGVALCDIDLQAARSTAEALSRPGCDVRAFALDVTDRDAWGRVHAEVVAALGPVDVLVNNAGVMPVGPFLEQAEARDRLQIDVNVLGVLYGVREVLPSMLARDQGHVVNIASVAGRVGVPNAVVYSLTKYGVVGLTEACANEYAETGVGFTYVCPAFVRTELISGATPPRFPPVATPEDVARATVRAIQRGRVEVYVPRSARISVILPALLPRRVCRKIAQILGAEQVFHAVDDDARRAYRSRLPV